MSVLVVDEEIHQSCLEKGPAINAITGALFQALPEPIRSVDVYRSGETGSVVRTLGGMELQRAYEAGKLLAILAEPGIVRDDNK